MDRRKFLQLASAAALAETVSQSSLSPPAPQQH